jgi:hypothetical protein
VPTPAAESETVGKEDPDIPAKTTQVDTRTDYVNVPVPDSSDDEDLGDTQPAVLDDECAPTHEVGDSSDDEECVQHGELLNLYDDEGVADVARLLEILRERLPRRTEATDASENSALGVVGFVGYPNVGKSTVINALVGAKKVGMSRTPGKTKHIQTLQLPEWGFTLCDAPGLVFPSLVATRAHLVINNTVPLEDLREVFSPISIIVQKVGFQEVLQRYRCASYMKDAAARSGDHVLDETHSFLAALAVSRNHFLRVGVPDENWSARKVLRDYCTGKLLHCEPPPGVVAPSCVPRESQATEAEEEEDDFDDLNDLIEDTSSTVLDGNLTKRKMRHLQKQLAKGIVPSSLPASKTSGARKTPGGSNARAKAIVY